jgi:hypothetical protein
MHGLIETAGERVLIDCPLTWVVELLHEAVGPRLPLSASRVDVSVEVTVEKSRSPFATAGATLLTRGAYVGGGGVVLENVCTTGFDLHLRCTDERAEFAFRWRPPLRERAAAKALRSRFVLLARCALLQYPALWSAGRRGRVPLHASACSVDGAYPLFVAAGGIGRSTLVQELSLAGHVTTGDNLVVGDGTSAWGLVEPLRITGAGGRRTTHGRRETTLRHRAPSLAPDRIVVLERGSAREPSIAPCDAFTAARAIVTSTYGAGELRRYWAFAATLAAGTGAGPAHPAVSDVAATFAAGLPCFRYALGAGAGRGLRLPGALVAPEVGAWA